MTRNQPDSPRLLRIGMIGAGFIAQVAHLHALAELPGCRVVLLADARSELRRQVAGLHRIEIQHEDPMQAVAAAEVDAFVVCLPRAALGPIVQAALASGRPVLSEKPMAHNVMQGRQLVAAGEASGAALAVGYMKRHDPGVTMFRGLLERHVANGEFGEIVAVDVKDFCGTYATAIPKHHRTTQPPVRRYLEWTTAPDGLPGEQRSDYGYSLNVVSHDMNLVRFLFGDLRPVSLRVRSGKLQVVQLESSSFDVTMTIGPADIGLWEQTVDVVFQRGRLSLRLPSPLARQQTATAVVSTRGRIEEIAPAPEDQVWAFKAQAAQFLDVVRGGSVPLASGRDSLRDLELIEQLWSRVAWSAGP